MAWVKIRLIKDIPKVVDGWTWQGKKGEVYEAEYRFSKFIIKIQGREIWILPDEAEVLEEQD